MKCRSWISLARTVILLLAFAACANLVVRAQAIRSHGQGWERLGPQGGDVISLATGGKFVYLGTADGHVFASEDAASHWELRGRVGARFDGVVQTLIVDVRDPQRVFAAIWYQDPAAGGGVYQSVDGGRTWLLAGLRGESVRALVQAHSNPAFFVAGSRNGVFRSNDGGRSWERISPEGNPELRNIDSLAIDPRNEDVIYAGTYHLPWKTVDGGRTWRSAAAGMIDDSDVMSLRLDEENPETIYASACSGIYRSRDGGGQWTKLQGIPYAARRTQVIVQDPRDALVFYAGTTEGLWITRDAGETWARLTSREWAINGLVIAAGATMQSSRLILGTEGRGVLVSGDGGVNFVNANDGFSHRVVADLVGMTGHPRKMLARVMNETEELLETRDAGKTWVPFPGAAPTGGIKRLFGTEAGWWAALTRKSLVRYDETLHQWKTIKFLGARSWTNPGQASKSRAKAKFSRQEIAVDVTEIHIQGARVYAVTDRGLWMGAIGADVLRPLGEQTIQGQVGGFDFRPGGNGWWVTNSTGIFRSADGGNNWVKEGAPEGGSLSWIQSLAEANSSALLVGTQHGVFLSAPPGEKWQLLQRGLPATASDRPLAVGKAVALAMKAGGFYLSRDSAQTWQRIDGPGEASVFVGALEDGQGGYYLGSRTEGILHWGPSAGDHEEDKQE